MRALLASLAALVAVSSAPAAVVTLNTADHPTASDFTLTLGLSGTAFQDSIGPTPVTGTMVADLNLDGTNSGTLSINDADLSIQTIGPDTLDLGPFGTLTISLVNVQFTINGGPFSVNNTNFQINSSTPGSLGFVGGVLDIIAATGFLGSVVDPATDDLDFNADPEIADFADLGTQVINGTVDDDNGLLDPDGAELNIPMTIRLDIGSGLFLDITGNFHVGTAIPETSTVLMTGLATMGFGGLVWSRRRRKS